MIKNKDNEPNNFRGIRAKYLPATNHRGARVRVYDTRRTEGVIISYNYEHNSFLDTAIEYLEEKGIEIEGTTYDEKRYEYTILTKNYEQSIKR